jgi:hypothetical protein
LLIFSSSSSTYGERVGDAHEIADGEGRPLSPAEYATLAGVASEIALPGSEFQVAEWIRRHCEEAADGE